MNTFTNAEVQFEIVRLTERLDSLKSFLNLLEELDLPTAKTDADIDSVQSEIAIWKNALVAA